MRCLDIPPWKPLEERQRVYKKLYPLLDKLKTYNVKTGTGGKLREVVMTRLSAAYCYQHKVDNDIIFVGYEPKLTKKYIKYLFGQEEPVKVYKMAMLNIPENYETLIDTLRINHNKAIERYQKEVKSKPQKS